MNATARLQSPLGFVVDLIAASCGIEQEVVERATVVDLPGVGPLPVARTEELLAMKVLSMSERRLQDRIDARNLILYGENLDLAALMVPRDAKPVTSYTRRDDAWTEVAQAIRDAANRMSAK